MGNCYRVPTFSTCILLGNKGNKLCVSPHSYTLNVSAQTQTYSSVDYPNVEPIGGTPRAGGDRHRAAQLQPEVGDHGRDQYRHICVLCLRT